MNLQSTKEYVEAVAPPDVRETLTWLEAQGYSLVRARGSRHEHMGDAVVVWAKEREVTITRDKAQWEIRLGLAPGGPGLWLDVLDAARNGGAWQPAPGRFPLSAAAQLPEGMPWSVVLPEVLAWLETPGAEEEAQAAMDRARELMRRRWRERHPLS